MMIHISAHLLVLAGNVPNPTGTQPPGTSGINTILNWIAWLATAAAVAGIFIVAGKMALTHHRGGGSGETGQQLGMVLGACVLIAAAGSIVGVLV